MSGDQQHVEQDGASARRGAWRQVGAFVGVVGVVAALAAGLPGTAVAVAPEPPPSQSFTTFCEGAPATTSFTDVASSNVHAAAIRCLVASEVTKGTSSSTYGPSGVVTRAQMATFLASAVAKANELEIADLAELPAYDGTPDFDDVPTSDVHFSNIMRLSQAGITSGTGPRAFSPARTVNREQMARFINNAVDFLTGAPYRTTSDYFTDDETSFAEADINGIASRGIAVGDGKDAYGPGEPVRRDQMASFLVRSLAVLHADMQIKPLGQGGEATDGPINGTGADAQADANKGVEVRSTDKGAGSFSGCAITTLDPHIDTVDQARCATYRYGADDTFLVGGAASTRDAFAAALSPYDDVTGTYSRTGKSTFSLRDEAALPPEAVTATAASNQVTLTIDDSSTPSVDRYNVLRAPGRTIPGGECQEPGLTFTLIGQATDPTPTADSGNASFPDTTVMPETTYCYRVSAVDDGDESAASVATGAVTTPAASTVAAGAPRSVEARVVNNDDVGAPDELDAGDEILLAFNESMAAPGNGDSILVRDEDGTLAQVACGPRAMCSSNDAPQAVGSTTYEPGRVISLLLLATPAPVGDATPTTSDATANVPATVIGQGGFQDVGGDAWDLAGSPDKVLDAPAGDTTAPKSIDVRVTDAGIAGFLDGGDTVVLVFDEAMRAADRTGDSFQVTGSSSGSQPVTVTCGTVGNATCALNTAPKAVGGTTYAAGRVFDVTLTATPTSSTGPAQLPAKIVAQTGFQDAAGNAWALCTSPDRTVDGDQDTGDAGTAGCTTPTTSTSTSSSTPPPSSTLPLP